ncbi:MAG: matrixin family metalloprotease [Lachnospiraceae bacterium]
MKKIKYLKIFLFMMALLCTFSVSVKAAEARKGLGYKWSDKYATVYFYCGFNDTWKNAISAGMSSWNAVKETSTNKSIVPLAFTSNSSHSNKIYTTSGVTWIAYTFPDQSNGIYNSANIAFNTGSCSFTVGAASGKYDIQTVATHELGHAIGVAHCHEEGDTSCFSATCSSNVMMRTISKNSTRRTLTDYDTASKQVIYW